MLSQRLQKLKSFYQQHHRLPSYSEMLKLFHLASKNSVAKIVSQLIDQNLIAKINHKLAPTKDFFKLPLLGYIKAGFPTMAHEEFDFMSLDNYLIDKPQSTFLLKVSGDSLVDIGIFPDDLVVIERKNQAYFGDIVLALIDGQWTLKIFRKINGRVSLEAANDKYPAFYPQQELEIFGVVKGVIRKIK